VSGQIPRVDYLTFLDYFVYFCFFSQFSALFASQITSTAEDTFGCGRFVNIIFMTFQFLSGVVCFEWMYSKLHNHSIDVEQWVKSCNTENERNMKLSKGLPVDDVGADEHRFYDAAQKAKRRSFVDLVTKKDVSSQQGQFTSFGAASVVGALLNQSKQLEMEKAKITEAKESHKVPMYIRHVFDFYELYILGGTC
jgi:hypothetical protein